MTRITPQLTINAAVRNSQLRTRSLNKYQKQLSTGLRLHKASDDAAAMERVLALQTQSNQHESNIKTIDHVSTVLNQTVTHLQEARNVLNRAKEIAIDVSQPGSGIARGVHVTELNGMLDRLTQVVNATDGNRYLFGGRQSDTPPFTTSADGVTYTGSPDPTTALIGASRNVTVLHAGTDVFLSTDRQPTEITGLSGAESTGGTDSARGTGELIVRHTGISFAGASGVASGTGAADNTIIGPAGAYQLTIVDSIGDGSAGTISLNGNDPVPFTNSDTNLKVSDGQGGVVYIDTTAITPGFNGTIGITADGSMSIDGGASEVAIDFSNAQILVDSGTGAVTTVDSSNVRRAATDKVDYPGTHDAFSAIIALRDALMADEMTDGELSRFATARSEDFERHADAVLDTIGEVATSLETLENFKIRTEDLQVETLSTIANLQGADMAEAAIGLQNEQRLLEMTYASLARAFDANLLDFIR